MVQGNRSAGYEARTELDNKGPLGVSTTKQGRAQREPTDGLESQHGTADVGPKWGFRCEASGRQYGTIDGRNSWDAVLLSGLGKRAAILDVRRSTPRSKKGPTTKRKYAKGQGKVQHQQKKGGILRQKRS